MKRAKGVTLAEIMETTVCFCHPIEAMISESVAPSGRWSIATT